MAIDLTPLTNLPRTDKMDAKLEGLAAASNTAFASKNFPMNKSPSPNSLQCFWEAEFTRLEYKLHAAAKLLHSPGNPSYQKHLKNSSITIKLT